MERLSVRAHQIPPQALQELPHRHREQVPGRRRRDRQPLQPKQGGAGDAARRLHRHRERRGVLIYGLGDEDGNIKFHINSVSIRLI